MADVPNGHKKVELKLHCPPSIRFAEKRNTQDDNIKKQRATFSLINIQLNFYNTYILKCSDDSYYVGVTNNAERRLIEHQEGINVTCYTYSRRPIELVYFDKFIVILQAIAREKQLKGWSRKKKEALIEERGTDLPFLSMAKSDK